MKPAPADTEYVLCACTLCMYSVNVLCVCSLRMYSVCMHRVRILLKIDRADAAEDSNTKMPLQFDFGNRRSSPGALNPLTSVLRPFPITRWLHMT